MKTLNSVLTISQNLDYGDKVRLNYQDLPIETYYLPSFVDGVLQELMPGSIILDLQREEFAACGSFLLTLAEIERSHSGYAPQVFLSKEAAEILRQIILNKFPSLSPDQGRFQHEELLILEKFDLKPLIVIFKVIESELFRPDMDALEQMAQATVARQKPSQLLAAPKVASL